MDGGGDYKGGGGRQGVPVKKDETLDSGGRTHFGDYLQWGLYSEC